MNMNEIITDIKALQEETLLNLKSSKANNTVRAYKSDLYALTVFAAFELLRFNKVSSLSIFISVIISFINYITIDNH